MEILTLNTLWNEYEFGLANRKAPKDFTAIEWGRKNEFNTGENLSGIILKKCYGAIMVQTKHVIKFTKCMDRIQLLLILLTKLERIEKMEENPALRITQNINKI